MVVVGEETMGEIPEGPWMQNPISDGQVNFIETLINQAIDKGKDDLAAEAKQFLNSGTGTQGDASTWIDKLKNV